MSWHSPHALEVLFSPEHGFFVWTPLALLAIAGLVILAWRGTPVSTAQRTSPGSASGKAIHLSPGGDRTSPTDVRWIAAMLLLMIALQVYVSGAVESWTVAGAFGQRRFVAVSAILVIGLTALWQWASAHTTARRLLVMVIVVAVYWNLALIALFGTRLMDRQRIDVARNAYDAFVTLPRMAPGLAWRYIAQRDTFYERGTPRGGNH